MRGDSLTEATSTCIHSEACSGSYFMVTGSEAQTRVAKKGTWCEPIGTGHFHEHSPVLGVMQFGVSASGATWTSKVPNMMAHIPIVLGIEAFVLGTLLLERQVGAIWNLVGALCKCWRRSKFGSFQKPHLDLQSTQNNGPYTHYFGYRGHYFGYFGGPSNSGTVTSFHHIERRTYG